MRRRQFLKATLLSVSGVALASPSLKKAHKPNIILIMADDLGYECLSCNGSLSYQTPVLDQLAEKGVRFTHAYAQPLCTPTRVQLMTGKYNFRNYTQFGSLKPGEYTFAHLLKDAGYKTCVVGKWQLAGRVRGMSYQAPGTMPDKAGFDEYCLWQIKHKGSRYWNPTVNINGTLYEDMQGKYGPDVFCDYALDFLERNADQPFFLYFPMALTHNPFVPTPDSDRVEDLTDSQREKSAPRYFGDMVEYMDKLVGRIVAKIESQNLLNKTLIIFIGDNGTNSKIITQTKSGPVQGAKGRTTAAGTHVPLIVHWQGAAPAGHVCPDLVDFTDFFPTIADAAGIALPGDYPGDGVSFLPQIKGKTGTPRKWIFCHYEPRWGKWQKARYVMDKKYKLYDDGRFYNLQRDPLEKKPIDVFTERQKKRMTAFKQVLKSMTE